MFSASPPIADIGIYEYTPSENENEGDLSCSWHAPSRDYEGKLLLFFGERHMTR
jgi:hypothetical protein